MVFVVLIFGVLFVRLLAAILNRCPRVVRALVATGIGVLFGLWALSVYRGIQSGEYEIKEGLIGLLDGLFYLPAILSVGASAMMVTLGCDGDGTFWHEYYSVGNTSYGSWDVGLGLIGNIIYGVFLAGIFFTILYFIASQIIFWVYFILQAAVCVKVLLTKE